MESDGRKNQMTMASTIALRTVLQQTVERAASIKARADHEGRSLTTREREDVGELRAMVAELDAELAARSEEPELGNTLLELRTAPLGFQLTTPDGRRHFVPLSTTAAQALILALLAQAGGAPTPELLTAIRADAAARGAADEEFLKNLGVKA
jgi:hypothetical protein